AVELGGSPAAAIELGHYLDNVDDLPNVASKWYAEAVAAARELLIEALIGQAKALRQLGKRDAFRRCLLEILHLIRSETQTKRGKADDTLLDVLTEQLHSIQ